MTDDDLRRFAEAMPNWRYQRDDGRGAGFYDSDSNWRPIPSSDDLPGQFAFVAEVAGARKCLPTIEFGCVEGGIEWNVFLCAEFNLRGTAATPAEAAIRAVLGDGA